MPSFKVLVIAIAIALAAALIVGLLVVTTYCACGHTDDSSPSGAVVQNTPPPLPTACGPNPAPAVNVAPGDFGYRKLTLPAKELPVSTPLRVAGEARPFEGAFTVRVLDRQGREIAVENFTKDNRNLAFEVNVDFEVMTPIPACVWVHEKSGRDGSPTNITQVAVMLLP